MTVKPTDIAALNPGDFVDVTVTAPCNSQLRSCRNTFYRGQDAVVDGLDDDRILIVNRFTIFSSLTHFEVSHVQAQSSRFPPAIVAGPCWC